MAVARPERHACVVLSPHLDDAVLSAWHVLRSGGDVCVVTVFAGLPDPLPIPDDGHSASHLLAELRRDER